jgi:hypothetical protein
MEGGISVSPKTRVERIYLLPMSKTLGIGNALISSNIINTPERALGLLPPTDDITPILNENRFRVNHFPTWCDLVSHNNIAKKENNDCDAGLPKITKNIQRGMLPNKTGRHQIAF